MSSLRSHTHLQATQAKACQQHVSVPPHPRDSEAHERQEA